MSKSNSKTIIKRSLSIVLYVLYLFIFLEVAARIAMSNQKFWEKIRQGDYVSDSKWRIEWVRQIFPDEDPAELSRYDVHDPILGWRPKPNVKDLPVFHEKFLNINSKGVRGKTEYPYQRVPGKLRIVILGESFSFGTEVSDDETYAHYLEELIPDSEVINLAVHGYGYDQMLLYLKKEGVKYRPDIVIIPYLDLDNKRSMLPFRDFAKPMFKVKNGKLKLTHTPVPKPEVLFKTEIFKSKFVDLMKILHRNIMVKNGSYFIEEEKVNKAIFHEMIKTIKEINALPLFAYLEGVRDVIKRGEMDEEDEAFFDYWYNDQQIHTVYLLAYIKSANKHQLQHLGLTDKPVFFQRKYGHFSPHEHQIIAIGIKDYLDKNILSRMKRGQPPF